MAAKYLTVKEFAERVGMTPQAIYLRLDKDLKPFLEIQAGRKVLSIKALDHFFNKEPCQDSSTTCQDSTSPLTLEFLQEQLEALQGQLSVKDKQIESLTDALQNEQKLHALAVHRIEMLTEHPEPPQGAGEPEPTPDPQKQPPEAPESELSAWELFKLAWHKTWYN